jgi:hypothetical protein
LLILRIKLLRNSLRNHPEIPNNTKNQNSEQKEIRIHNERSQQQKSNDNSENLLVNCVFIFVYDNNCLYWIENKLYLFIYYYDLLFNTHTVGIWDTVKKLLVIVYEWTLAPSKNDTSFKGLSHEIDFKKF